MERHSIDLTWEREALDVLADGYNVKYGARSIKHEVSWDLISQILGVKERFSHVVISFFMNEGLG